MSETVREEIDVTKYFHEEGTEADPSVLKDVAERKTVSVETENDEMDGVMLRASKMEQGRVVRLSNGLAVEHTYTVKTLIARFDKDRNIPPSNVARKTFETFLRSVSTCDSIVQ